MPIFRFWGALTSPSRSNSDGDSAGRGVGRQRQGSQRLLEQRSYEAVGIRVRASACQAARTLAGKRFLVADAPPLPLESCNVHCKCTYRNYEDRRQEPRRSADVGVSSRFYVGSERRSGSDRRMRYHPGNDDDYYGFMRERSGDY